YEKGHRGGPGRPPREHETKLTSAMDKELLRVVTVTLTDSIGRETKKKMTNLQAFVRAQVAAAVAGDVNAAKLVWERYEGKLPTPIEHDVGGNVEIIFPEEAMGL
ncbi:hypothetical protein LCGC14_3029560, partial [marine sediment metagenome]